MSRAEFSDPFIPTPQVYTPHLVNHFVLKLLHPHAIAQFLKKVVDLKRFQRYHISHVKCTEPKKVQSRFTSV
jgi:hypothetical protein